MLDALRRFWRHLCRSIEYHSQVLERLEQAEIRIYALEQDMKRMTAVIRSMQRSQPSDRRDDRPTL